MISSFEAYKSFNYHYATHQISETMPSRCWDNKLCSPLCQTGKKLLDQWVKHVDTVKTNAAYATSLTNFRVALEEKRLPNI